MRPQDATKRQPSNHLDEIISKSNQTANLQIVFADIVKYSKRRTLTQIATIDSFTHCLEESLNEVSREYITHAQKNDLNFQNDIILLPTGDGAAVVFSFEGLHDIHLSFAKAFLKNIHDINIKNHCDKFMQQDWCNCHNNFFVRIGISEGRGIIYKDVNGVYNVAGKVINLAARVMGLVDKNQIAFTEDGYEQIIDVAEDSSLIDCFEEYLEAGIKHGELINILDCCDLERSHMVTREPCLPVWQITE